MNCNAAKSDCDCRSSHVTVALKQLFAILANVTIVISSSIDAKNAIEMQLLLAF